MKKIIIEAKPLQKEIDNVNNWNSEVIALVDKCFAYEDEQPEINEWRDLFSAIIHRDDQLLYVVQELFFKIQILETMIKDLREKIKKN